MDMIWRLIAAWIGDKDLAFEQLERIIRLPSPLSYGDLKLLPFWDPLRGDPAFRETPRRSEAAGRVKVVAVVAGVSPANPTIAAGTAASTVPTRDVCIIRGPPFPQLSA